MLSREEFETRRKFISEKRVSAMKDLVRNMKWSNDTEKWLLGFPHRPPPNELNEYCDRLGTTYVVRGCAGKGLSKEAVKFYEGDMITFALGLARGSANRNVAVLNMANAHHVGGGFLTGSRAQEEQLCHRSTLFPRLKQYRWYGGYPIFPGTCLVTPNVHLLLEDDFTPVRTPVSVTVLSAAAEKYEREPQKSPSLMRDLFETWLSILTAANASGCTDVVVSAIGSGAFKNPPDAVGESLHKALLVSPSSALCIVHVVILDDHNSRNNVRRFREGFANTNLKQ